MTGVEDALPTAGARQARRRLARLIGDRRCGAIVLVGLAGVAVGVQLIGPVLIGAVVDAVDEVARGERSAGDARSVVLWAAGIYAIAAFVGAVLVWAGVVQAASFGESALAELRTEAFDHAVDADVDRIERGGSGDLVARLTGDVNTLATAVQRTLPVLLLSVIELLLTAVALFLVEPALAAVAILAAVPSVAGGTWWYARRAPSRYRRERESIADLSTVLLEGYDGEPTLRAFGAAEDWRNDGIGAGAAVIDARLSSTAARNVLRPAVRIGLACSLVAVIAVGAAMVDSGSASLGAVSAVALYVIRSFDPIGSILEQLDELQQATASLGRIVGITQLERSEPAAAAESSDGPARAGSPDRRAAIALLGVTFGYGDRPVIDGLDLRVEAGERIVVVGPSGAGKSTLAKLIAGFHHPQHGDVLLAGRPTTSSRRADSPHRVCLVTQESHSFARSLRDNLSLARGELGDDEARSAFEIVGALGWYEGLPNGLDTIVGTADVPLDPVRRQQLALARLVCASPAVVVLDEATASLDPIAAARTEAALERTLAGRTVIAVAHRLDVAARADRVVVMEQGRIVADGHHDDLVAAGGAYAELWSAWTASRGRTAERFHS
ncbi:MAG: ABC transporter ATP-binding protein [Actinomycetota bacterium]